MLRQHYYLTLGTRTHGQDATTTGTVAIYVIMYIQNLTDIVTISEDVLLCDAIELATAKHEGA
jgi:hypothetical protein